MNIAFEQREKLQGLISEAIEQAVNNGDLTLTDIPEINLETPKDPNHGDFASNIALVAAKAARKPPRDVAAALIKHIPVGGFVTKVEVAGPGFINFFLSQEWLQDILRAVEAKGQDYGTTNYGQGEKVLLEFVSANPVGPLNVVNARAAAVGDTLARLMRACGYQVGTEFYVNDAGNQADVFSRSLVARCHQLVNPDFPFPEDGYPGDYVNELARRLMDEKPDFLDLPMDEQLAFCKRWGTDQMVEWQAEDLRTYGVEFDRWFRERDLHAAGELEKAIEFFREKGYLFEEDGALWFRSTQFGDDKDRVLIKNDGAYTYVTADIAYHYDKLQRGYTKLIDILGPDHHGYIGRMKAAIQALGYGEDALEVLILQYVALLRDGQPVKMSKRAGEFVTMQELLDEVGTDAARYFFLMRSPESHLDFDLNLAVEQSSENPVFYVQYAHARICSILRQAEEAGVAIPTSEQADLSLLTEEAEVNLIKKLGDLPEEIVLATVKREPHRIARYALDLASIFHSFYTHCHVLGEEAPLRDARLVLVKCVQIVLKRSLGLLGISAPEQM